MVRYPCPRNAREARLPVSAARELALKISCVIAVLLLGVYLSEGDPPREFDEVPDCDWDLPRALDETSDCDWYLPRVFDQESDRDSFSFFF